MTPIRLSLDKYEQQLAEKIHHLRQKTRAFQAPDAQIFRSKPAHYRTRAEFRIWHDQDDLYHLMFDQKTKKLIRIDYFMAGSMLINALMSELLDVIRLEPILRTKLFQIDYLTTQNNQALISLIYHRPLYDPWYNYAVNLRNTLRDRGYNIQLIGRAKKSKICLNCDYVDEYIPIAGRMLIYRQIENSFTQPNFDINIHMLEWALAATKDANGDLLELYCGNGNFSLAMAHNFNGVLATEIDKLSVQAAQHNIAANHVSNVKVVRMSTEEFTQAMQGERKFIRLKNINLQQYRFETIFVNPPRRGLDNRTIGMVQTYPRIVYISCNLESLCQNLIILSKTHTIEKLALFDQFPYTPHIECGVLLVRKMTAV
ncbi:tRNA (uridine(54)-C5)-methyltransferase TrmA [Candidatus Steffania adelgidicola]|uniref:tRNA (uridine(54)-C5)-methyltransferase TrmA n=1 Tax=Candidatus Steffania adelgidicola TaxID=1076626 RepID=UPI001D01B593|nr:tRNA (uridine(54)-C5)-methyltransferase TrmA [Candidatus Steffania adelgidicola]UDG79604.1 tRNA/tmRNA (uracil-C(5))-methyltransferase [Candidatus Steffania adelgidicola]